MLNSSVDDAMLLLNKWKDERALMQVSLTKGDPVDRPDFRASLRGTLAEVTIFGFRVEGEASEIFVGLRGAVEFRYLEAPDTAPDIRETFTSSIEGCLSFYLATGEGCMLCCLRTD